MQECYTAEARHLHEMLANLRRDYEKAAQPYIDRLVMIQSLRSPAPMLVTAGQAQQLGLKPKGFVDSTIDFQQEKEIEQKST